MMTPMQKSKKKTMESQCVPSGEGTNIININLLAPIKKYKCTHSELCPMGRGQVLGHFVLARSGSPDA